jgi:D-psicose/D-tagatose/L-ribulose 3-epimerase
MRLAISNIAWPAGQDEAVAPILIGHGAEGVEIAPTKIWPKPLDASRSQAAAYRSFWERRGLKIVALQALLFGRPDLTLFGEATARVQTVAYLKGTIALASALGAEVLVFGSPKNRRVGTRPRAEVDAIAADVFRELGEFAGNHEVFFCIEPNPVEYDCDYLTSAAKGAEVVERVGCTGFGLHLDTGAMTLAGDPVADSFARANGSWRHFHVSEPNLACVGRGGVDHPAIAAAVRNAGYSRWVSIEMREAAPPESWISAVRGSLDFVRSVYFSRREAQVVGVVNVYS